MNQDCPLETRAIPHITTESTSINTQNATLIPQMNVEPPKQVKENTEGEERTTLPLIKYRREYSDQNIIKEGLVLCTRTAEWFTRKKSTMREVQLRKTRLRWRQFKAVLKPNRIELYHVTVSLQKNFRGFYQLY